MNLMLANRSKLRIGEKMQTSAITSRILRGIEVCSDVRNGVKLILAVEKFLKGKLLSNQKVSRKPNQLSVYDACCLLFACFKTS